MAIRDLSLEQAEQRKRLADLDKREQELDQLRRQLAKREAAVEHRMLQEKKLLEQREMELFDSVEKRNSSLSQHEQSLARRQEEAERELLEQRAELAKDKKDFIRQQQEMHELARELEQDRQRLTEHSQKALQDNSKKFVGAALNLLSVKEKLFHWISGAWAVAGAFSLLMGVVIAVWTMFSSSDTYHQSAGSGLAYYFFHLFRGLVVVGLCGVLSRYAFIFSKSYMHESLKIGERAHAIRFGEFYLDTYGANAHWSEVKEAFAHWNINGQSAFSEAETSPTDPAVVGAATNIVEKVLASATELGKKSA
ncbi:hypothetical protein GT37_17490 [Pseudomonas putida]|nr:hypothetical protein GT37_17490 [Pseudomonas putida]